MKYSIKQARKALQIEGKPKIQFDNIIDYVASGKLDMYIRCSNWTSNSIHSITIKDTKIWSDKSTDNKQNFEIIREAIRKKTKFKLILWDKIKDEKILKQEDIEKHHASQIIDVKLSHEGNRISGKELVINPKGVIIPATEETEKAGHIKFLDFFRNELPKQKIKDFKEKFPSRFGKIGPYETTRKSNTFFSEPVALEDIYFLEKDVQSLKSIHLEEKYEITASENKKEINTHTMEISAIGIEVDITRKIIYVTGHKAQYKWNELFGTNNNQWEVIQKLAKNKGIVPLSEWSDVFPGSTHGAIKQRVTRTGKVLQKKLKLDKNPLSAGLKACSSKFKTIKIYRNTSYDAMNKVNPNKDSSEWLKNHDME